MEKHPQPDTEQLRQMLKDRYGVDPPPPAPYSMRGAGEGVEILRAEDGVEKVTASLTNVAKDSQTPAHMVELMNTAYVYGMLLTADFYEDVLKKHFGKD